MKRTILVIDDDESILETISLMLAESEFEIVAASGAEQGLVELGSRPIDLIITDIVMPEIEGIELISRLRSKGSKTPILAMSGGGRLLNLDFLKFAEKLGARAILEKPFRRAVLLDAISKALSDN